MAASTERIFRKVALERLSSPEQLDQLVPLTSPIGWTAVIAIAALVAAAIGWSIFGVLPTSVNGSGILVSRGGRRQDQPCHGHTEMLRVPGKRRRSAYGHKPAILVAGVADAAGRQHRQQVPAEYLFVTRRRDATESAEPWIEFKRAGVKGGELP